MVKHVLGFESVLRQLIVRSLLTLTIDLDVTSRILRCTGCSGPDLGACVIRTSMMEIQACELDNECQTEMNSSPPLVSVWMITFNHGPYIRQALDSVFSQDVDFDFEVVIGDDGSSDDTRSIILEFDRRNPGKIKKIFHAENVGMIANQNSVFAACRGEYIAMLEGDDYWTDPCKMRVQVEAMTRWPQCRMSFHPCRETKNGRRMSWYGPREKVFPTQEVVNHGGYFSPTPSLMLKRKVVESIPDFLEAAPAGDYYLQILGSLGGGALYLPQVMCAYRVNSSGSWSDSVKTLQARQAFRIRSIEMVELMDKYLNFEFSHVFQRKSNQILRLVAFDYLKNGQIEEFGQYLDQIEARPGEKDLYYRVIHSLRSFPRILLFMEWSLNLIREVRGRLVHMFERC